MLTCTKIYRDIPFAHRQPKHDGHCSLIHGHNWAISITFACREPDENGFVIDFGDLKFIKDWIADHLDHACLFDENDPLRDALINAAPDAWKPLSLPNTSCEGLARHLFVVFNPMVREHTIGRVWVTQITVHEDDRNSATFRATAPSDCPYRDPYTA